MSDWDQTVVIGKNTRGGAAGGGGGGRQGPTAIERGKAVGAITENDRKVAAGTNKGHVGVDHAHLAKLDRENDVAPPPKVAASVGKAIAQARADKGMTQKDLGQKINEKPQVIQEFESSKAQPNPQVLTKMERALGVKLRGANVGAPLNAPAAKKK